MSARSGKQMAIIASYFDTGESAGDVNADGLVDIYDLVIAAANYDRAGPVGTDWPDGVLIAEQLRHQ